MKIKLNESRWGTLKNRAVVEIFIDFYKETVFPDSVCQQSEAMSIRCTKHYEVKRIEIFFVADRFKSPDQIAVY